MAATPKAKVREKGGDGRRRARTPDGGDRRIMRDGGYAAATSRRVAARAGVRSALVYYYFPTMDDLFVAVPRSGSESSLARMRQAITAEEPLRALWEINTDSQWSGLHTEFMALANHRKVIGAELKAYAERVRDIEPAATVALRAHGIDRQSTPGGDLDAGGPDCPKPVQRGTIGMTEGTANCVTLSSAHLNRFVRQAFHYATSMLPGVNRHRRAGDVAGLVGGQEQHRVADVHRLDPADRARASSAPPPPCHRGPGLQVRTEQPHRALVHEQRGVHVGRMHGVDPDEMVPELDGEGPHQPTTPCLAAM